jgi:hypothetical protein
LAAEAALKERERDDRGPLQPNVSTNPDAPQSECF